MERSKDIKHFTILALSAIIHWIILFQIPYAEYDTNYALMFYGLIGSVIIYFLLVRYWYKNRTKWKRWIVPASIYSIIASPITFFIICKNIQEIFGVTLKF